MLRVCSLLVLLATPALATPALAGPLTGTARIIDGDTLGLATPGGEAIIRLHGIDAAERGQSCADAAGDAYPCGARATEALGALVGRARVTCEPLDMDRHERIVARCAARGRDLGQAMVAAGMARAYLRYATDYLPDENAARAARRGQWVGEAEEPALYRLARTTHAARPPRARATARSRATSRPAAASTTSPAGAGTTGPPSTRPRASAGSALQPRPRPPAGAPPAAEHHPPRRLRPRPARGRTAPRLHSPPLPKDSPR